MRISTARPLRRSCRRAALDSFVDRVPHFLGNPGEPASSGLYPLGELAGRFEARDMRKAVRDSKDGFEFLLGHQFLCHRTLPSKREQPDARRDLSACNAKQRIKGPSVRPAHSCTMKSQARRSSPNALYLSVLLGTMWEVLVPQERIELPTPSLRMTCSTS